MSNSKKELKKEYKQTNVLMGVYQIRNLVNGKVLVGAAANVPGILNSHRFQLAAMNHPNKSLQADWKQYGAENFSFETVDELSPTEGPGHDYREELAFLEELWLEKIEPYGERGYNERKMDREEKLRRIAQKRSERV